MTTNPALDALRRNVTGKVEAGLAEPITELPAPHLRASSCHVCGTPTRDGAARPACQHDLTNAEAFAAAAEHDRQVRLAHTPEAAYVAEHRPY